MPLAAQIQVTDQDIYQQSSIQNAEVFGQLAQTDDGRTFVYANSGGALTAGQLTQPAAVTANYATRTLSIAVAQYASQVTVTLGTTAAQNLFAGFWLVVTDGTGKGQGAYSISGNTAATAGNSNATTVSISEGIRIALDTTSVVGIYPSQAGQLVQHTATSAIPAGGVPSINITSGFYFWSQVGGYTSVLSDGAISKNALAIPSASVAGAATIDLAASVTQVVGFAPELTVDTKYSPLVLQIAG